MKTWKAASLLAGCVMLAACGGGDDGASLDEQLASVATARSLTADPAAGLTVPDIDSPLAQLGRDLFFTKALGAEMTVACATCHHPLLGGGDNLSLSVGVNAVDDDVLGPGRLHDPAKALSDPSANNGPNVPRNAQTTFNVGLYRHVMFHDGRVRFLDRDDHPAGVITPDSVIDDGLGADLAVDPSDLLAVQARFPVVSHAEMRGFDDFAELSTDELRAWLASRVGGYGDAADELSTNDWPARFREVFDQPSAPINEVVTYGRIATALAEYQRSQHFVDNPWFAYLEGDADAISASAKRGALLFYRDVEDGGAGCHACHTGDHFTDESFHVLAVPQIGRGKGQGGNSLDPGAGLFSEHGAADDFAFRTPSLLNTEVTGPWGHDGVFDSLEDVIRHHLNPAVSVTAFDFTLDTLAQFDGLAVAYPNAEVNSDAALARYLALQEAGSSRLVETTLSAAEVADLKAFLLALTDPCVKSEVCLTPWIPAPGDADPDGLRLVAEFPGYAAGSGGGVVPVAPTPKGTAGTVDVVATLAAPACAGTHLTPGAAGEFRDVADEAGLDIIPTWVPAGPDDPYLEVRMKMGGISAGDLDGDCLVDLYVTNGSAPGNAVYRNDGNGAFTDVTAGSNLGLVGDYASSTLTDLNADGKLDVVVGGIAGTGTRLFLGDGAFGFDESEDAGGITPRTGTYSITPADYNLDGYIDLFLTHWSASGAAFEQHLWRNNGNGTFVGAHQSSRLRGELPTSHTFVGNLLDVSGDAWPDLLSVADFRKSQVFHGYGGDPAVFANRTRSSVLSDANGMGAAVADFDLDGDLDWFVTSIYYPSNSDFYTGNRLYLNDGAGNYTRSPENNDVLDGGWAWGACAADFDLDGDPDIFQVNGWGSLFMGARGSTGFINYMKNVPSRLFVNDGTGGFAEQAAAAGVDDQTQGRSALCLDYDRDGDIDILVGNNGAQPHLYLNGARDHSPSTSHYLTIRLRYLASNRDAVGALVRVTAGGRTWVRPLGGQNGYMGHGPHEVHVGLGAETQADTIEVLWPARVHTDGRSIRDRSVFSNVAADRYLEISHPSAP